MNSTWDRKQFQTELLSCPELLSCWSPDMSLCIWPGRTWRFDSSLAHHRGLHGITAAGTKESSSLSLISAMLFKMEGFSWWLGQYPEGCERREGDWSPPICFGVFATAHMIHATGSLPRWVQKTVLPSTTTQLALPPSPPLPFPNQVCSTTLTKRRFFCVPQELIRWDVSSCAFFLFLLYHNNTYCL